MKKSLLSPPTANKFQGLLGLSFLKLTGWEAVGNVPHTPKFVMLLAPHTSNWDLFLILAILYLLGIKFFWFGKKEIFQWPVGWFFKWLGGIPIDRSLQQNVVQQTAEIIQAREQIIVGISPEGTRSNTKYWKTGFYYIACQAQIPIVFAFLDYGRKAGGLGPIMNPTGDIEEDMKTIRHFYSGITAKHPHNFGNILIKPRLNNESLSQ
ncbi:MAG: lysophospholipid acyltransferase family protein [Anaerolineales bacterium]|nr:lysophospholipid acyltransferase family protein [Anaerolineales bacterium]